MAGLNVLRLVEEALREANRDHIKRGVRGLARTQVNAFGDMTLVADWEAEERIIELLRAASRRYSVSIRVVSEEHGEFQIGVGAPDFTVIIDGLDGSSVFATTPAAVLRNLGNPLYAANLTSFPYRYGTMVGVALGGRPRYDDMVAAGIVEHTTRRLMLGGRGRGTEVINLSDKKRRMVHSAGRSDVQAGDIVYCDTASRANEILFAAPLMTFGINTVMRGSAAAYYFDVASGAALASLEWTRKRNLEAMIGYLLVREAGGEVVTLDGSPLGGFYYDEWGQTSSEHFIAAANTEVAMHIRHLIGVAA